MYEEHFGLRERVFDLKPNPRYFLLLPGHREALANIEYGIQSRQGITLLIGEAGTGKTTLVRRALSAWSDMAGSVDVVCLNNPVVTRREFLDFLADRFQVDATAATSKPRLLHSIEQRLRAEAGLGRTCVLVIDEAQALSDALLEEVRLLANLESDTEKLLPVILSGQPELAKRLNQPHLRQLKQRIALRCSLDPLTLRETALYIAARVQFGGGKPAELFTESAIRAIYDLSGGIPRTINVVCENALLSAFAASRPRVEPDILEAVGRDFDLNFSERLHVAAATPADSADPANTIPFPPGHRWTSIPQVARRLAKRR